MRYFAGRSEAGLKFGAGQSKAIDLSFPTRPNDNCECDDTKSDECGNFPPTLDYNDGAYCTWYCAKKESK